MRRTVDYLYFQWKYRPTYLPIVHNDDVDCPVLHHTQGPHPAVTNVHSVTPKTWKSGISVFTKIMLKMYY